MEERKVKALSGIFWANDLLNGHSPLPFNKGKEKQNNEFGTLLDVEMEKLKHTKEVQK